MNVNTQVLWILSLSTMFFLGCERDFSGYEPPLRPLVYTELPPSEAEVEEAESTPIVNVAPEDLGYGLFQALVDHDRTAYDNMFIDGAALAALVHMKTEDAQKQANALKNKSEILWTLFSPSLQAEEPIGGLSSKLRLLEFRLGKGRNLAGKVAQPDVDEVVQHWGNELRIELLNSDKTFTIRVPKIVRTPGGWRIASPVELDKTLQIYLECGMHLKDDLLTSEHYPMPLEVGNYWKYRIERARLGERSQTETTQETPEMTATDMIKDIVRFDGYWIVTFERTMTESAQTVLDGKPRETYAWLVTPRMIFPCLRDCRNNGSHIGYLLGYMMRQTPLFVFPAEVGRKWSVAGRKELYSKYEIRSLHDDPIVVPAGSFTGVYEIFGSIEKGRETRYFMPGTGVVMRTIHGSVGQTREVLMRHRLIF